MLSGQRIDIDIYLKSREFAQKHVNAEQHVVTLYDVKSFTMFRRNSLITKKNITGNQLLTGLSLKFREIREIKLLSSMKYELV